MMKVKLTQIFEDITHVNQAKLCMKHHMTRRQRRKFGVRDLFLINVGPNHSWHLK